MIYLYSYNILSNSVRCVHKLSKMLFIARRISPRISTCTNTAYMWMWSCLSTTAQSAVSWSTIWGHTLSISRIWYGEKRGIYKLPPLTFLLVSNDKLWN